MPEDFEEDFGFEEEDAPRRPLITAYRTQEQLEAAFPQHVKDLRCGDCGAPMRLKEGRYGVFYGCVRFRRRRNGGCRGTHGAHQETGLPYGIPANQATRTLRRECHELLKRYEHRFQVSTVTAYAMLAKELNLPLEDAHFGKLLANDCERAKRILRDRVEDYTRVDRILERDIV